MTMKKILFAATAVLMMMGAQAQNTFKGTITYKIESTGQVAFQIPADQSVKVVKVYENKAMLDQTIQNDRVLTSCVDFSPYIQGLLANDIELETYTGDGKMMLKSTIEQSDIDSLTIPVTEGYYFEYVDGETEQIAGITAKKTIMHNFNDEGEDEPIVFWYSPEIGPAVNFLFGVGIKGLPLKFTVDAGEGKAITYTATEVKEGKVKEVYLLLPAGYTAVTEEEYANFMQELKDAIELLQE